MKATRLIYLHDCGITFYNFKSLFTVTTVSHITVSLITACKAFAVVNLNNQCKNLTKCCHTLFHNTIGTIVPIYFGYSSVPMILRTWNIISCSGAFTGDRIRDLRQLETWNWSFNNITVIIIKSRLEKKNMLRVRYEVAMTTRMVFSSNGLHLWFWNIFLSKI